MSDWWVVFLMSRAFPWGVFLFVFGYPMAFGVLNWARDRVGAGREPFFPVWGMRLRRRGWVWLPRVR